MFPTSDQELRPGDCGLGCLAGSVRGEQWGCGAELAAPAEFWPGVVLTRCPRRLVEGDKQVQHLMRMWRAWDKAGVMHNEGGFGDQPNVWAIAMEAADDEKGRWEAEQLAEARRGSK